MIAAAFSVVAGLTIMSLASKQETAFFIAFLVWPLAFTTAVIACTWAVIRRHDLQSIVELLLALTGAVFATVPFMLHHG